MPYTQCANAKKIKVMCSIIKTMFYIGLLWNSIKCQERKNHNILIIRCLIQTLIPSLQLPYVINTNVLYIKWKYEENEGDICSIMQTMFFFGLL